MKLREIKTARELKLPGIRVEFVTEGTSLKEVILRPEEGDTSYLVKPGASYADCLKAYERIQFETKTVHRVSGTLLGGGFQQDFDTPEAASKRIDELRDQDPHLDLGVQPVNVIVDEAGEPVATDDIPF